MSRLFAYGFSLALVAAVASPVFGDPPTDSYPLSTYPMFSRKRGKPMLHFLEGVERTGKHVRIPPELVANAEVMQAAAAVRRAVRRGKRARRRLCTQVAERLSREDAFASVVRVEVVAARFDPIRYFVEGPEPDSRDVLSRCPVPGRS